MSYLNVLARFKDELESILEFSSIGKTKSSIVEILLLVEKINPNLKNIEELVSLEDSIKTLVDKVFKRDIHSYQHIKNFYERACLADKREDFKEIRYFYFFKINNILEAFRLFFS